MALAPLARKPRQKHEAYQCHDTPKLPGPAELGPCLEKLDRHPGAASFSSRLRYPRCARPLQVYETEDQKLMTKIQESKHGGSRSGAGRTPNILQRCKLLAIQLDMVCSESTARRHLNDNGGQIKGLVSEKHLEVLDDWENMSSFDRGFAFGYFFTCVGINRKEGWGVRL
jgi:hypothetical protein